MAITRREFVGGALATGATLLLPGPIDRAVARSGVDETNRVDIVSDFTFVHLTDMHVTPKRWGDKGYRQCIESVRALRPKPALAIMGGDLAFDGLYTPKAGFEEQIRLYKEISAGLGMPFYNCMGNHDVLGWSARRKVPHTDPDLGKKLIMDRLEWDKSTYSFDFGGWHFAILDCIHPVQADHGPTYEPRIGEKQLDWLAHDLGAAGDRPKICVTHIAAFCNLGQINGDPTRKAMDGSMVLWDNKELRHVLERHKVTALLQGHSHRIEEFRLNDVWYLTSAAVSGAWWAGDWTGSAPGYTVFRCRAGQLTWAHHLFPWEPHLEAGDDLERRKIAELRVFEQRQEQLLGRERCGRRSPSE